MYLQTNSIQIFIVELIYPNIVMGGSSGGDRGSGPTMKYHKNNRVSMQYWSGSLKNHKVTKPAFNVGTSSARQRNDI